MREITERQLCAFKSFLSNLPHGREAELVLLKGHILIKEQVRLLIDRRLRNPEALRDANARLDSIPKILRRYFLYDRKLLADLSRSRLGIPEGCCPCCGS